jgi:chromosome segregation ATPase
MMGFTPADVSSVNTLLAIIADPVSATENLQALVQAKADSDKAREDALAAQERAFAALDETHKALEALAQAEAEHDAKVVADKGTLDLRTAALDEREKNLRELENRLAYQADQIKTSEAAARLDIGAHSADLDGRERALADAQIVVEARESAVAEAESKVNALITQYSNKLAALKQLAE